VKNVLTAVKVVFFPEVTPYSLVNRYQCFIDMTRNMMGISYSFKAWAHIHQIKSHCKAMIAYLQVITAS